jgi:hypothetical protein
MVTFSIKDSRVTQYDPKVYKQFLQISTLCFCSLNIKLVAFVIILSHTACTAPAAVRDYFNLYQIYFLEDVH